MSGRQPSLTTESSSRSNSPLPPVRGSHSLLPALPRLAAHNPPAIVSVSGSRASADPPATPTDVQIAPPPAPDTTRESASAATLPRPRNTNDNDDPSEGEDQEEHATSEGLAGLSQEEYAMALQIVGSRWDLMSREDLTEFSRLVEREVTSRLSAEEILDQALQLSFQHSGMAPAEAAREFLPPGRQGEPDWMIRVRRAAEAGEPVSIAAIQAAWDLGLSRNTTVLRGGTFSPARPVPRSGSAVSITSVLRAITPSTRGQEPLRRSREEDPSRGRDISRGGFRAEAAFPPTGGAPFLAPLDRAAASDPLRRQAHSLAQSVLRYIHEDARGISFVGDFRALLLGGSDNSYVVQWFLRDSADRREWAALLRGEPIPRGEGGEGLRRAVFYMAAMTLQDASSPTEAERSGVRTICEKAAEEVCGKERWSRVEARRFLQEVAGASRPPQAHARPHTRPPQPAPAGPAPRPSSLKCHKCGGMGHKAIDCRR